MTVKQLIDELNKYDQNATINVYDRYVEESYDINYVRERPSELEGICTNDEIFIVF